MLPTALRCLTASLRTQRSPLLELLCDPLQSLAPHARAPLHYTLRNNFQAHCFATQTSPDRVELAPNAEHGSDGRWQQSQHRMFSEQPAVRSDKIFTYEGPLQKAVGNLKAGPHQSWQ